MKDLFADGGTTKGGSKRTAPQVIATYDYLNLHEQLCFQVVRKEGKRFQQRRPAPDGGWINGVTADRYERGPSGDWYKPGVLKAPGQLRREFPAAERVLFRAPQVAKAVSEGARIFFVEGEKDVLTAERLGLVATTNSGGAKAPWASTYTEILRGADVWVIPDRDGAGEHHARRVATELAGAAKTVVLRQLPAEDGIKDLTDLVDRRLAEGRTLEEIRSEVENLSVDDARAPITVTEGPLPLHRELPEEDPYPIEVLPKIVRDAVETIAALVQVAIAMAAQSVLAVASFVTQAVADIEIPASGQSRPVGEFYLSIAPSGDRKTSTDEEASRGIAKREEELRERYGELLPAFKNELEAWTEARKAAVKAGKGVAASIREKLDELGPEPEPPPTPILRVGEPTWEGLVRLSAEGAPSLALFSSEGGEFLGGHAMNRDNVLKSATGLSKLWDGQPISRTRGGDGARRLAGRRLTVHLAVQPMIGDEFLGDRRLWSQGLLSRFLVAAPRSLAGKRFWNEGSEVDRSAIESFDARVLELLRRGYPMRHGKDERTRRDEGLVLPSIPFSRASRSILREFYNETEMRVGHEGELAYIRSFANKGLEHACRLSGILALLEGDIPREIPVTATEAGIILAQYYIGESLRLREVAAVNPDLLSARGLLDWMSKEPGNLVTLRRILQFGPHALRNKETATRILKILEDHRYIERARQTEIDGVHVRQAWRVIREVGS